MTSRLAFRFLGVGPLALLVRLLLLLLIGVPLLLFRCTLAVVVGGGVVWGAMAITAGGTGVVTVFYRPAIEWMHTSDTFQTIWETALTDILPQGLNIGLYATKLMLELWNGFCPYLAAAIDAIFEVCVRLANMLWNQGVLQYMLTWLMRLFVFMVEPVTDALVTVLESLIWAEEWVTDGDVNLEEGACATGDIGEMLLGIVVITLTILVRYAQLFWQLMLPLMYAFVRIVLPRIVRVIPDLMEVVTQFFSIFTTPPVKRVIIILIEAFPMLIEMVKIVVCSFGVYGGAIACILMAQALKSLNFFLRYFIKPMVCGGMSFICGCLGNWIHMKTNSMSCMECGDYSTACGCTANSKVTGGQASGKWQCRGTCTGVPGAPTTPSTTPPEDGDDPSKARGGGATTREDMFGSGDATREVDDVTQTPLDGYTPKYFVAPEDTIGANYKRVTRGVYSPLVTPSEPVYECTSKSVIGGQLRCDPPSQPAPPPPRTPEQVSAANFQDVVQTATVTASASFYAPMMAHHVEGADDEIFTYFTRGTLPYLLPGNVSAQPDLVNVARYHLSLRVNNGGYGPALLQTNTVGGWTPPAVPSKAWIRVAFDSPQCVKRLSLSWGNAIPTGYVVSVLSGVGRATQLPGPSCVVDGAMNRSRVDQLTPISPAHNTPHWGDTLADFVETEWARGHLDLFDKGNTSSLVFNGYDCTVAVCDAYLGLSFSGDSTTSLPVRYSTVGPRPAAEWYARHDSDGACPAFICTPSEIGSLFAQMGNLMVNIPHLLMQAERHSRMATIAALPTPCCTGLQLAKAFDEYALGFRLARIWSSPGGETTTPVWLNSMRSAIRVWAVSLNRHLPIESVVAHAIQIDIDGEVCRAPSVAGGTSWASTIHTGGVHLTGISVYTVAAEVTSSADASPSRLHGVVAHGRVIGQTSPLRFWDPCGKCTLSALTDGQYSVPVVFYFAGNDNRTGEIHFALQSGSTGEAMRANVTAITIVFGPNSQIPSPVLCTGEQNTDCIAAVGADEPTERDSFVPPHIKSAAHSGDVVVEPPASFFASQVAQDKTLRFEFPTPRMIEEFRLLLPQHPDATGPETSWGAVKEDNLLFGASLYTAWMESLASTQPYDPSNNLDASRGHYPSSCTTPYSDDVELPERNQWQPPYDEQVCEVTASWYTDPFKMPRRHWSIGEVSVEGLSSAPAGGRRVSPSPPPTVSDLMASLHHRPWAAAGVTPRRVETVQNALRAGPLPDAHHSPFPKDMKTMPDPAAEVIVGCSSFFVDGKKRMTCNNLELPMLGYEGGSATRHENSPHVPVATDLARTLGIDQSQLAHLRTVTARALAQGEETITTRQIVHSLQMQHEKSETLAASRRLMGDANPEKWVEEGVRKALEKVQEEITGWMRCNTWCESCGNLAECIMSLPVYAITQAVDAIEFDKASAEVSGAGEVVMKLLWSIVQKILSSLSFLEKLFAIIDGLMNQIASQIFNNPKQVSCQACAFVSFLSEMVSEWVETLDYKACLEFLEDGREVCSDWGMGWKEMISSTFSSMAGTVRLGFMLGMALPAVAEVVLEWGILFMGTAIEIFPSLLGDAYEILGWVISSSSVLQMLEPLMESFDPIIDELAEGLATATSGSSCGSSTRQHQAAAANTQNSHGSGTAPPPTRQSLDNYTCPVANDNLICGDEHSLTHGSLTASPTTASPTDMGARDVSARVAGCGCVPTPPVCNGTARGGVHCKYGKGNYEIAMEKSNFCPPARKLLPVEGAARELVSADGGSCPTQLRKGRTTIGSAATLPVYDFAPGDYPYNGWAIKSDETTRDVASHWRRLLASKNVVTEDPSRGMRILFGTSGDTHFLRETRELADAVQNISGAFHNLVAQAPTPDGWRSGFHNMIINAAGMGRRILQVTIDAVPSTPPDLDIDQLECVVDSEPIRFDKATNRTIQLIPSTYACCRHFWCCIPPIPREFRFRGEWFRWRESWYTDTKCEWIGSVRGALSYAFRAPLKLLYDTTGDVDHWPFDSLIEWTYETIGFEGGAWPESDHRVHLSCLVLNMGYVMVPTIVALTLFLIWSPLTSFLEAGCLIGIDTITTTTTLTRNWYHLFWTKRSKHKDM